MTRPSGRRRKRTDAAGMDIRECVETIESGYEFLLSYAAQGRPADAESGPGPHARPTLEAMAAAMAQIAEALGGNGSNGSALPAAQSARGGSAKSPRGGGFIQVVADDCRKAGAAVDFVLAQKAIGSEMVDNLNASIHLRAVLTDLFLYSEALEPLGTAENLTEEAIAYDATKTQN